MRLSRSMSVLLVCSAASLSCGAGRSPEPARSGGAGAGAGTARSEAATTRELEAKAADYEDRFRAIQESDLSPEEKAAEASRLADEQQRTLRDAADGRGDEASGEGEDQP